MARPGPQPRILAPTRQASRWEPGRLLGRRRSLGSRLQLPLDTARPPPANLSLRWTSHFVTVTGADCSFPGGGMVCRRRGTAGLQCVLFLSHALPVFACCRFPKAWEVDGCYLC